ncbi:hypothetical protein [Helicobacter pylori]|uniref:hypothetical protein n=1 Tax=Helicobacter pylori TaxID=210 RepID=UPI0009AFB914|nr:hypothetical protein [Helicobacter pylori]
MAINSRERIKYIHVIKLGALQNKRQNQQQALLGDVVAEKTKQNNERKQQWNSVSMKQKDKRF